MQRVQQDRRGSSDGLDKRGRRDPLERLGTLELQVRWETLELSVPREVYRTSEQPDHEDRRGRQASLVSQVLAVRVPIRGPEVPPEAEETLALVVSVA